MEYHSFRKFYQKSYKDTFIFVFLKGKTLSDLKNVVKSHLKKTSSQINEKDENFKEIKVDV